MSGVRQHTIPRFLLRGFAQPAGGNDEVLWLYRRGEQGIRVSTRNVGVGKRFYDSGDACSADPVNRISVRCSYEFFLSSQPLANDAWRDELGADAGMLSPAELGALSQELASRWPFNPHGVRPADLPLQNLGCPVQYQP